MSSCLSLVITYTNKCANPFILWSETSVCKSKNLWFGGTIVVVVHGEFPVTNFALSCDAFWPSLSMPWTLMHVCRSSVSSVFFSSQFTELGLLEFLVATLLWLSPGLLGLSSPVSGTSSSTCWQEKRHKNNTSFSSKEGHTRRGLHRGEVVILGKACISLCLRCWGEGAPWGFPGKGWCNCEYMHPKMVSLLQDCIYSLAWLLGKQVEGQVQWKRARCSGGREFACGVLAEQPPILSFVWTICIKLCCFSAALRACSFTTDLTCCWKDGVSFFIFCVRSEWELAKHASLCARTHISVSVFQAAKFDPF